MATYILNPAELDAIIEGIDLLADLTEYDECESDKEVCERARDAIRSMRRPWAVGIVRTSEKLQEFPTYDEAKLYLNILPKESVLAGVYYIEPVGAEFGEGD